MSCLRLVMIQCTCISLQEEGTVSCQPFSLCQSDLIINCSFQFSSNGKTNTKTVRFSDEGYLIGDKGLSTQCIYSW